MGENVTYISDKGPVFRIHNDILQFSNKKTTQLKNGQRIGTKICK